MAPLGFGLKPGPAGVVDAFGDIYCTFFIFFREISLSLFFSCCGLSVDAFGLDFFLPCCEQGKKMGEL